MCLQKYLFYILLWLVSTRANAQHYLHGDIKNEKKEALERVRMLLASNNTTYYSGAGGVFTIGCKRTTDSLTLSEEGYETITVAVKTDSLLHLVLHPISSNASKNRKKIISIAKNKNFSSRFSWFINDESYFSLVENEVVAVDKFPNTGFSLNINKASYSNIRRFLTAKSMVPPDAVRIEELLNYFNLHYRKPENDDVFKIESQLTDCPWNTQHQLLLLNINARKLDFDKVPPSNLVFLIDGSGSMDVPNRLPLVKAAFQLLVKNLREQDTVSIVLYGGTVVVWLPPTGGAEKQKITRSIEELSAHGDTPGESAIKMAYKLAQKTFIKGGNNRVILATDGDFNVGETSEKALEDLITEKRKSGIYLTCLGVGMGNFKDSKLQTLAKRGNGNYAYLDDLQEAEKVLVKEMTQTFFSVADNVFLNVHFNPDLVKDYRLIGFDNRKDAIADSIGDLEGGEVGSGNSVLAIFEITPTIADSNSVHYIANTAKVSLKYNMPQSKEMVELNYDCAANYLNFQHVDREFKLGTAIAMFGMKLRQSQYLNNINWSDIERIAKDAYDPDDYLQQEFYQLLSTAKKVYGNKRKRHRDN